MTSSLVPSAFCKYAMISNRFFACGLPLALNIRISTLGEQSSARPVLSYWLAGIGGGFTLPQSGPL